MDRLKIMAVIKVVVTLVMRLVLMEVDKIDVRLMWIMVVVMIVDTIL